MGSEADLKLPICRKMKYGWMYCLFSVNHVEGSVSRAGVLSSNVCKAVCNVNKDYVCPVWTQKGEPRIGGNSTGLKPPGGRIKLTIRKHFLIGREECFYSVSGTLLSTLHKLFHLTLRKA